MLVNKLLAFTALVAALAWVGCGGDSRAERLAALERQIRQGIQTQFAVAVRSVECPDDYDRDEGFECQVVTENGVEIPVTVAPTDADDDDAPAGEREVEWKTKGLLVRLDFLEKHIEEQLAARGKPARADCGGKIRPSAPGETVICAVAYDAGGAGTAKARILDERGAVELRFE